MEGFSSAILHLLRQLIFCSPADMKKQSFYHRK